MQPGQRFVVRLQNQAFVRLQATFFSSIQISLARVRAAVSVLPVGRIYWVGKAQRGVSRTLIVLWPWLSGPRVQTAASLGISADRPAPDATVVLRRYIGASPA
jgi:hypothetical protein